MTKFPTQRRSRTLLLTCLLAVAAATDAHELDLDDSEVASACCHEDGLYATVVSGRGLSEAAWPRESTLRLRGIEGFYKPLPVDVAWQEEPAPLTVLLLGLTTRSDGAVARAWRRNLHGAGQSVLSFDAFFTKRFARRSRHGVAGNLRVEAERASAVIESFLRRRGVSGRVTRVNVVGLSYGGLVALHLAKLSERDAALTQLHRVVAFSPPVSLRTSARIVDTFCEQDLANYGALQLLPLLHHPQAAPGAPVPFEQARLRAGVGHVFRRSARRRSRQEARLYRKEFERAAIEILAERDVTFRLYLDQMAYPFWRARGAVSSANELWEMGELEPLLLDAPSSVRVVLAADDPLNDADELRRLQARLPQDRLIVLPRGGHLGFQSCGWVRDALAQLMRPDKNLAPIGGRQMETTMLAGGSGTGL